MPVFHAIILGVVQGITEFLPISSSAHLYLAPYILGWEYQGLGFDVALHWGTLLAVVWIFWRDYLAILKNPKMLGYLILASIPAAFAGFFLQKQIETGFRNPLVSVITLSGFAVLLWYADKNNNSPQPSLKFREGERGLSWGRILFIGAAQALSLVPGVSRSGITATAGLFSGLSREQAVRFSFLLSGPAIFGAGLVALKDLREVNTALIAGFAAAAISGFLAIKFLLRYVSRRNFNIFVWYRIILAIVILCIYLNR